MSEMLEHVSDEWVSVFGFPHSSLALSSVRA